MPPRRQARKGPLPPGPFCFCLAIRDITGLRHIALELAERGT
jgi:hypothetical protein